MDKKEKEKLIVAIMVFVLISLLFFSSVAFGQVVSLQNGNGQVTGTVYCDDGISPLQLNNPDNGSYIGLYDATNNSRIAYFTSSASGSFSSPSVPAGNYYLIADNKGEVGNSTVFGINASEIKTVDLQTSRMPMN